MDAIPKTRLETFSDGIIAIIITIMVLEMKAPHSADLAAALGSDWKGKLSLASYVLALGLAFVNQWLADALYVGVAVLWLIPDRRIERLIPVEDHFQMKGMRNE